MTYATSNPPALLVNRVGGSGAIWYYTSADIDANVDATDYFTNGDDLGMKVGDVMFVHDTAGVMTLMFVSAVTAGGAATVTAGTVTP